MDCHGFHGDGSTWACCFEFCIWRFWDQIGQAAWLDQLKIVSMSQVRRLKAQGRIK